MRGLMALILDIWHGSDDSFRPKGDIECRVEPPLRQRASDVVSRSAVPWMHSMMSSSENHNGSD